jgi:hypothetical protein
MQSDSAIKPEMVPQSSSFVSSRATEVVVHIHSNHRLKVNTKVQMACSCAAGAIGCNGSRCNSSPAPPHELSALASRLLSELTARESSTTL